MGGVAGGDGGYGVAGGDGGDGGDGVTGGDRVTGVDGGRWWSLCSPFLVTPVFLFYSVVLFLHVPVLL